MRKITITQALNELKLYDAKIDKAISSAHMIIAVKKSADKIGSYTRDEYINKAKASYQSVTDLIRNRSILKAAIVKSNAETEISIDGVTMTVAEAIERKNSIVYDKNLLAEMKRQYSNAITNLTRENKRVDEKIDELLSRLIGESDKKITSESQEIIEAPYRAKNEFELINPLELETQIEQLEASIDGFESNCDIALSMSNATTFIEVE